MGHAQQALLQLCGCGHRFLCVPCVARKFSILWLVTAPVQGAVSRPHAALYTLKSSGSSKCTASLSSIRPPLLCQPGSCSSLPVCCCSRCGRNTEQLRKCRDGKVPPPETIAAGADHWEASSGKAMQLELKEVPFKGSSGSVS